MKRISLIFSLLLLSLCLSEAKITVHTIGDSTMADYDESTTDKRGWCQYLQSFFNADTVIINNRGKSGADSRTFYQGTAYWPSVKSQMKSGDFLLIQFAHNDEGTVTYGTDNLELAAYNATHGLPALTDARGTCPYSTYRDMLRLYIDEARQLGVTPVLVGPICRKYFNGNTIRRNGQHDLGDKFWKLENDTLFTNQSLPASDHTMDYVEAMRVVAQEKNVTFVDLTAGTRDLYLQLGEAACTSDLFCSGDNTHLQAGGAMQVGRLGAQLLKEAGVLSDFISIPTEMTVSPSSIDLGEVFSGVSQTKEILLSGSGLSPETGTVSVSVSGSPLLLSLDGQNFVSSLSLSYAGGALFQRIKVQALYTSEAGAQTDSVIIACEDQRLAVPVSASVVSLSDGTSFSASWAMTDKTAISDVVVDGPVAAALTMAHLMPWDVKAEFTLDASATESMVRLHNADDANAKIAWPANEIDENASRYIDFAVTAPDGLNLRITRIAMEMAAHSTSVMCLHVNTGFGDAMTGVQTICEKKNMTNKQIYQESWTPNLSVPAATTLHVRVLPWHEMAEEKSGKYVALRNVVIEGVATQPATGLPSASISDADSAAPATKLLINGQLIILRDGAAYTPLGQILR